MISVIVSTYKRPERLKKAIQSVLNQTYDDWELIIVSDGPDEASKTVAEAFKDPRIRYFEIEHFGKHSRPKNHGLQQAKGEYVAFLDDDNTYRPDHLNALYRELIKDPAVDLVYGDRWVEDEDGKMEPRLGVFSDFDPIKIFHHNYIDTSDTLCKTKLITDIGGWDERYQRVLDWNLWIRLVKAGKRFKRVPLVLTNYFLSSDSISRQMGDLKEPGVPGWSAVDVDVELPFSGHVPKLPKIAVFSITYERVDYSKLAFASLYDTAGYPFDHYIVDNGSKDGTVEWLTGQFKSQDSPLAKARVIFNPDNRGISIASNQALDMIQEHGGYDIIMKIDNDCIFQTPDWMKRMVELYLANHRLALSCYVCGLKDNPGGAQRLEYGVLKGELIGMTKHLGGICHFVSAEGYKDFRWPEDDTLHGFQDLYFSNHLLANGWQMGYLENYYCSHGPRGTVGQYEDYRDYFERRAIEKQKRYQDGQ